MVGETELPKDGPKTVAWWQLGRTGQTAPHGRWAESEVAGANPLPTAQRHTEDPLRGGLVAALLRARPNVANEQVLAATVRVLVDIACQSSQGWEVRPAVGQQEQEGRCQDRVVPAQWASSATQTVEEAAACLLAGCSAVDMLVADMLAAVAPPEDFETMQMQPWEALEKVLTHPQRPLELATRLRLSGWEQVEAAPRCLQTVHQRQLQSRE